MRKRASSIVLGLQSTAIGGMETHVIDLAAEYQRRGIAVRVIMPRGLELDAVAARAVAAGAQVRRLTTDGRDGRSAQLRAWFGLVRSLREAKPDVVHLHTGGATGGLGFVLTARLCTRATVAITEHDVPGEHRGRRQRLTRGWLDRTAHIVVAVSRRNAGLRRERVGIRCRSFAAVLNGVPLPAGSEKERGAGRATVRADLGIGPDETVIGSLVRLADGKGLETLLEAFVIVRRERACRLLLVGDGPKRAGLEALASELGVHDDVVFAGNQPGPGPFLDAMDVFALAVPAGSMSIALLEAMARGLPPVITFCGPEEAVIPGETGLGAEPNNPAALAAALASLVRDESLRRALGAAAAAHVRAHFSVARVADDLLEAYRSARGGVVARRLEAAGPLNARPGTALSTDRGGLAPRPLP